MIIHSSIKTTYISSQLTGTKNISKKFWEELEFEYLA
jgi:hypothetical protein